MLRTHGGGRGRARIEGKIRCTAPLQIPTVTILSACLGRGGGGGGGGTTRGWGGGGGGGGCGIAGQEGGGGGGSDAYRAQPLKGRSTCDAGSAAATTSTWKATSGCSKASSRNPIQPKQSRGSRANVRSSHHP